MNTKPLRVSFENNVFPGRHSIPYSYGAPSRYAGADEHFEQTPFGPMSFYTPDLRIPSAGDYDARAHRGADIFYDSVLLAPHFLPDDPFTEYSLDNHDLMNHWIDNKRLVSHRFDKVSQMKLVQMLAKTEMTGLFQPINLYIPKTVRLTDDTTEEDLPDGSFVLKPLLGSSCMGIHVFDRTGIDKTTLEGLEVFRSGMLDTLRLNGRDIPERLVEKLKETLKDMGHYCPSWLHEKNRYLEQRFFTGGQVYSLACVQEKLDIAEEWRIITSSGGTIIKKRLIHDDVLPLGEEYDKETSIMIKDYPLKGGGMGWDLPEGDKIPEWVMNFVPFCYPLLKLCSVLSIDVFMLKDGRTGVLEFSNEFSLAGAGISNDVIRRFIYATVANDYYNAISYGNELHALIEGQTKTIDLGSMIPAPYPVSNGTTHDGNHEIDFRAVTAGTAIKAMAKKIFDSSKENDQ